MGRIMESSISVVGTLSYCIMWFRFFFRLCTPYPCLYSKIIVIEKFLININEAARPLVCIFLFLNPSSSLPPPLNISVYLTVDHLYVVIKSPLV